MYSKLGSVIINLILGIVMWWSLMAFLLFIDGSFEYGWKDCLVTGVITVAWLGVCIWYNFVRYKKMIEKLLSYGKSAYFLTLFIPLLFWTLIMFFLFLFVK